MYKFLSLLCLLSLGACAHEINEQSPMLENGAPEASTGSEDTQMKDVAPPQIPPN